MTANQNNVSGRWLSRVRVSLELGSYAAIIAVAVVLVSRPGSSGATEPERKSVRPPVPRKNPLAVPTAPVSLAGAAVKGDPAAKVGILLFSDFECPFCARFATDVLPEIDREFIRTGQVLLAFRHWPIEKIHRNAMAAAISAACSERQKLFWPLHDALFAAGPWTTTTVDDAAKSAGLQMSPFLRCRQDPSVAAGIASDLKVGSQLGITGTPAFFIGFVEQGSLKPVQAIAGFRPAATFKQAIEELLTKAK